jgi:hypothetical protein
MEDLSADAPNWDRRSWNSIRHGLDGGSLNGKSRRSNKENQEVIGHFMNALGC